MKIKIIIVLTIVLFSCSNKNEDIKKIWITDPYTDVNSDIIQFNDTGCYILNIRSDYREMVQEEYFTKWKLGKDSLTISYPDYSNKYLIEQISEDSLSLTCLSEDADFSSHSVKLYSLNKSDVEYSEEELIKFIRNKTLVLTTSNYNKKYLYEFVSDNKCINRFDSIYSQLEYYDIKTIDNEVFLILKYPTSLATLHLLSIKNDSVIFEYAYNGLNKGYLEKFEFNKSEDIKEQLIGIWFYEFTGYKEPLPPIYSKEEIQEFVNGVKCQILDNNTYIYASCFEKKYGKWKLSPNRNYIILDSLKNSFDIINIESSDSLYLSVRNQKYHFDLNDNLKLRKIDENKNQ